MSFVFQVKSSRQFPPKWAECLMSQSTQVFLHFCSLPKMFFTPTSYLTEIDALNQVFVPRQVRNIEDRQDV